MQLLGVNISELKKNEMLKNAEDFLRSGNNLIFTPNPEMLVKSVKDKYFQNTLNCGALNICDGAGIALIAGMRGSGVERVAGVDFMLSLCELARTKSIKIYLLGSASDEIAEKTKKILIKVYPGLQVVGAERGIDVSELPDGGLVYNANDNDAIISRINSAQAQILFVAFGMGKQEKWLAENITKMPSVRIGMGVGGAFDYISGTVARAPLLMQKLGLEWAYRLVVQPERFRRIFNATFKFIYLVLINKNRL